MTPVSLFPNRNIGRNCRGVCAGRAGARHKRLRSCSKPPPCTAADGFPAAAATIAAPKTAEARTRTDVLALTVTGTPSKSHNPRLSCCLRSALLPAISCPGAFRTPAIGACGWLRHAGIRKPAQLLKQATDVQG